MSIRIKVSGDHQNKWCQHLVKGKGKSHIKANGRWYRKSAAKAKRRNCRNEWRWIYCRHFTCQKEGIETASFSEREFLLKEDNGIWNWWGEFKRKKVAIWYQQTPSYNLGKQEMTNWGTNYHLIVMGSARVSQAFYFCTSAHCDPQEESNISVTQSVSWLFFHYIDYD